MHAVYAVGGPELGRRNDFISGLRSACASAWGAEPESHRLYAHETPVSSLLDLLLNGSLFSPGKFVQYFGADQVKAKADVAALAAYAKKPADNTVLVLVSDGIGVDKGLEDALPKDAKKVFWELSPREMGQWVRDFFGTQGVSIDGEAAELLLDLVENNTEALRAECSRLCLFHPRGSSVGTAELEAYIAHNRAEDAFSLFDRMATGDLERSLETLSAIMSEKDGAGVGLMGGLLWSFRRLAAVHAEMERGQGFEQAARSQRITRRSALASYDAARRIWPAETCERLVAFGVETDVRLRESGQALERTLLELFVYGCVVKRGPVALTGA